MPPDPAPTAASWIEVRVSGARDRQAVIDALFAEGAEGVHEAGAELVTNLPAVAAAAAVRDAVLAADPSATVIVASAPEIDWSAWRASVQAHRLGALTVAPPWLGESGDPASTVIIDPAMAFGTGEHATTRGVIRLMQRAVVTGSTVADIGAGSAILSIAAAKLGATRVIAIEIDPDAAGNAAVNIRVNGVADRVHFIEGDAFTLLPLVAPVDVVVANILSSVLIELLPVMHSSLVGGGRAILSGILREERAMMLDHVARGGWQVDAEDGEEEWWSVLISRQ